MLSNPKILGLIRGLRGADYGAVANVVERETERLEGARAERVTALENLANAVVESGDRGDIKLRRMANRALDLLIVLDERDLKSSRPMS